MRGDLAGMGVAALAGLHPSVADFLAIVGGAAPDSDEPLAAWLAALGSERLMHAGMDAAQVLEHLRGLVERLGEQAREAAAPRLLTVLGGRDKAGRPESLRLDLRPGDIACVVGPTGSGKSRLLADIECLAQGDTPSGRRVLVDGHPPGAEGRWRLSSRLVAQVSQHMNFVVDLAVGEFIDLHAGCRMVEDRQAAVERVVACANELSGEPFGVGTPLTQLSGGQSRALMIADTALLSASPVVLIDEIENAGVDRRRALHLLIAQEKIVVISTHDPLLALLGGRRIAVANGAVREVIATSPRERELRAELEAIDRALMEVRERLRRGGRVEELPERLAGPGRYAWTP